MNAIQLAIKAAIENAMGNLPPEVLNNIGQIGEFVKTVKDQLNRIENQQRLIMARLEIPSDTISTAESDDGQRTEQRQLGAGK